MMSFERLVLINLVLQSFTIIKKPEELKFPKLTFPDNTDVFFAIVHSLSKAHFLTDRTAHRQLCTHSMKTNSYLQPSFP